jgi:hypothetical protein
LVYRYLYCMLSYVLLGRCPDNICGSYGSSISSFLRNLHNAFHSDCTNLLSHQQCISVLVSPHPHQHLLLLLHLIMVIQTGAKWNLSAVLICISFITREAEHFFMYLLAICTSFFENFLFNSCAYFFTGVLILWGLSFLSSCRFWILVPFCVLSLESSDYFHCCAEAL